jgi:glycosyltransferase involved in cell wall biosynthesis
MASLRVGIDGYNLAMPHGTGVATYGYALAETLRSMDVTVESLFGIPVGRRPELREVLFFEAMARGVGRRSSNPAWNWVLNQAAPWRRLRVQEVPDTGRVERRPFARRLPPFDRLLSAARLFDTADRWFEKTGRLYPVRVDDPPAVMHWTYPLPVRMVGARNVYTLHDLVPLRLPYATLDRKRLYLRLVETLAAEADQLCTVSEASRRDILEQVAIDPARVTNTYQVAPLAPEDLDAEGPDVAGLFGLIPRGYFLYFGAIEPKKNIGRMLEAFLSSGVDLPLVLVGARAWAAEGELGLLSGRAAAKRVIRMDYLPRRLLMRLAAEARAVLFPSLYEGFGLPVLEAMQLGTPVLTSNTSALPEVAGTAAELVDPYDTGAIAAAIRRLATDDGRCADQVDAGFEQAQRFSAEAYRERLGTLYELVLSRAPRRG